MPKPFGAKLLHWPTQALAVVHVLLATAVADGGSSLGGIDLILTAVDRFAEGIHGALANLRRT
jgi:hypothetical protein